MRFGSKPAGAMVCAIAVIWSIVAYTPVGGGTPTAHIAPSASLTTLMLGENEVVGKAVLSSLRYGTDHQGCYPQCAKVSSRLQATWNGKPVEKGGRQVSSSTTIVAVAVVTSSADAVRCAQDEVRSTSVVMPEVTGQARVAWFADRAWASATSVVFTRANAVCIVFTSRPPKDKPDAMYEMAGSLSRRIDAVCEGRPYPPTVMPLSSEELGVELPDAWRLANIGEKVWGKEATTIALSDAHGIPRSIPAKKLAGDDYLVPLRHVAGVINRYSELHASKDGSEVTLDIGQGKIHFGKGRSRAEKEDGSIELGRPAEYSEGELLVPVSVAEKLTGKRLVWEKRDSLPIGRLETDRVE